MWAFRFAPRAQHRKCYVARNGCRQRCLSHGAVQKSASGPERKTADFFSELLSKPSRKPAIDNSSADDFMNLLETMVAEKQRNAAVKSPPGTAESPASAHEQPAASPSQSPPNNIKIKTQRRRHQLQELKESNFVDSSPSRSRKEAVRMLGDTCTVRDFARGLGTNIVAVLNFLDHLGSECKEADDTIPRDEAEVVASTLGVELSWNNALPFQFRGEPQSLDGCPQRSPIVCVLGHVDHGKTTLLDALRKSNRAALEVGGITQGMAAFHVPIHADSAQHAVFLDTPGHAAFHSMRKRGTEATDIVVLVVSGVESVQPQTVEAIKLAVQADVPLVVAINKMDRAGADADAVRRDLLAYGVQTEQVGGDVPCAEISASRGDIGQLVEAVSLTADLLDLRAPVDVLAEGVIVERNTREGQGACTTALVLRGTLKVGDPVVCDVHWGRVRRLEVEGQSVQECGPGSAVDIYGIPGTQGTGSFMAVPSDEEAQELVEYRARVGEEDQSLNLRDAAEARLTVEDEIRSDREVVSQRPGRRKNMQVWKQQQDQRQSDMNRANRLLSEGDDTARTLNVIVKADTQGSLEAILDYLSKLPLEGTGVWVRVLAHGVGHPTLQEVELARLAEAQIITFSVSTTSMVMEECERVGVRVLPFNIILKFFDFIRDQVTALRVPEMEEQLLGTGSVLQKIDLRSFSAIGLAVTNGEIAVGPGKPTMLRVKRSGAILWEGTGANVVSFRHFRKDIQTATKGMECSLVLPDFDGVSPGDVVECSETVSVQRPFNDEIARGMLTMSQAAEALFTPGLSD